MFIAAAELKHDLVTNSSEEWVSYFFIVYHIYYYFQFGKFWFFLINSNYLLRFNPIPSDVEKLAKIVFVQVYDQDCQPIHTPENRRKRSLEGQTNADLRVDLEVKQVSTFGYGYTMKCLLFHNNVWSAEHCTTQNITHSGETATVHCDCSIGKVPNWLDPY